MLKVLTLQETTRWNNYPINANKQRLPIHFKRDNNNREDYKRDSIYQKGATSVFELGDIYTTAGIQNNDGIKLKDIFKALYRYMQRDWGDVDADGKAANDKAAQDGHRIVAIYTAASGERFWILTGSGHRRTMITLPSEFN